MPKGWHSNWPSKCLLILVPFGCCCLCLKSLHKWSLTDLIVLVGKKLLEASWPWPYILCLPHVSVGPLLLFLCLERTRMFSEQAPVWIVFPLPEAELLNFSIKSKTVQGNNFPVGGFSAGSVATATMPHKCSKVIAETFIFISGQWWWPMTLDGPSCRTQDSLFGHD